MDSSVRPVHKSAMNAQGYLDARSEDLIEVVCSLSYNSDEVLLSNALSAGASLLETFKFLFPVVTFLVDQHDELDRDTYWRGNLEEQLHYRAAGFLGAGIDLPNDTAEIFDRHAEQIALAVSAIYINYATAIVSKLVLKEQSDGLENSEENAKLAAKLMQTCDALREYLDSPRMRVFIHAQMLPAFKIFPSRRNGEENKIVKQWNYENLASFGYSLCAAMSRGQSLSRIGDELASRYSVVLLPRLKTLFSEMKDLVDDLDDAMRERTFREQPERAMNYFGEGILQRPFTSSVAAWVGKINYFSGQNEFEMVDPDSQIDVVFCHVDNAADSNLTTDRSAFDLDIASNVPGSGDTAILFATCMREPAKPGDFTIPVSALELDALNPVSGLNLVRCLN